MNIQFCIQVENRLKGKKLFAIGSLLALCSIFRVKYCMNGIAELAVGNIVRRVLHIIREEGLSFMSNAVEGLRLTIGGNNENTAEQEDCQIPFAAAVAARSLSCAPSLCSLLGHMPGSAIAHHSSATGHDSEGKGKCKQLC